MRTEARFPGIGEGAGHYESFYIKASRPGGGQAVWIRHTIHKRPGEAATASLWFTLFDADAQGPQATKLTVPAERATPPEAYVEIAGARLGPQAAAGQISDHDRPQASWELAIEPGAEPFRHLPYDFLYSAPLPKTKLLSPHPDARFTGTVSFEGTEVELDGWPGMVGHNWGKEHAERWIWTQTNEFRQGPGYFDAAMGRIKVGPLLTPWIANAVLCVDGERHRLGGLDRIRSTRVEEEPTECSFELAGKDIRVRGHVLSEPRNFVGWVYADPDGPEHNTVNCSISDLELTVERKGRPDARLECIGAAAYELGMRETGHGIELEPFPDG